MPSLNKMRGDVHNLKIKFYFLLLLVPLTAFMDSDLGGSAETRVVPHEMSATAA